MTHSVWKENGAAPADIEGQGIYCGLDLSSTTDLTALVAVSEYGDVAPTFWLPDDGLSEKSRADRVPYDLWRKQGFLARRQAGPSNTTTSRHFCAICLTAATFAQSRSTATT